MSKDIKVKQIKEKKKKGINKDVVKTVSFILVISFAVTTYIIAMKYGSRNIERIE